MLLATKPITHLQSKIKGERRGAKKAPFEAMLDEEKLKKMRWIITVIGIILALLVGYGLGSSGKKTTTTTQTQTSSKTQTKTTKNLTQKQVEKFLVAYYTKKDLGENRNRYKEYMTDLMYNQEVSTEDEAVNQAYKGYVVDYIFKSADIYIDETNLVAIVKVRYTNTLLAKKNNYENAQKNVSNESTLRLTFVEQNNKLLVNKKESVLLTFSTESDSDYPDYGTLTDSTDTTDSSETTE